MLKKLVYQLGGIGALIHVVYVGLVLRIFFNVSSVTWVSIGALVSAIPVVLIKEEFTDHILGVLYGRTIYEVHKDVEEGKEGEKFFHDAEEDIRSRLDDLDQKSASKLVTMISGLIIIFSLSPLAYFRSGQLDVVISSVVVSIFALLLMVVKPYFSLRKTIKSSSDYY